MRQRRRAASSRTTTAVLLVAAVTLLAGCGGDEANGGLPASGYSSSLAASDATGATGSSMVDRIFGTSTAPTSYASYDVSIDDSIAGGYGAVPGADMVQDPGIGVLDDDPFAVAMAEDDLDGAGDMDSSLDYASFVDEDGSLMAASYGDAGGDVPIDAGYGADVLDPTLDGDLALEDELLLDEDLMFEDELAYEDDMLMDAGW